ncbi:NPCBM-associated, NEW3 domain of alpha-galactosidase [Lentzea waywayandensis]|uniref:NPCBM-associated, NEW3 domain of alpha-galactosidase n=1 Tax=Lentzea waywayandensis TaxID=84724 RepID=A0A1I6EJ83_9PSEU|nr:NEW3 domain-containing protein [Lentzea waywayandensis]SFR17813.1 NPCBM-associated, NEW3 domain of alpha-galactosidase [Lentzea waywayandensis]
MIAAESTELFVGPRTALLQVVRLTSPTLAGPVHAHVSGPGLHSPRHGGSLVLGPFGYELGVDVSSHPPGAVVPAQAVVRSAAGEESCTFSLVVGSPGWTVHLVGHVAADAPFAALRAHLDLALTDPAYRFAVTSVELLQPYWDTFPQHRSLLLRLISEGRVEVVGSESNVVGVAPLLSSLPSGSALVASSLGEAERSVYSSFLESRSGASAPHVMLPVGGARDAPNPWVTAVHHDWSARYTWPRIVCSLPHDYYVRGSVPVPPGSVDDSPAAVFASHAARLTGAAFPTAALRRAALAHPREAFDLQSDVVARSLAALTSTVDSSVVVWNPLSSPCTDIVSVHLAEARNVHVEFDGVVLPTLVDGVTVTFLARGVPGRGWRTYSLVEDDIDHGWQPGYGTEIASTHYVLSYDPIASLVAVDGPALESPRLVGPISVWHSEVGEKMVGSTTFTLWHEVGHLGPSSLFAVLGTRSPAQGTLPSVAPRLSLAGPPLGPVSPAVTPVFARYWLHEPAPLGGLPANVQLEVLSPTRLRVVAVSDGPAFSGVVRLSLPDGWSASWDSLPVSLPAGGYVSAEVALVPPRSPGCYPVRATLEGLPFEVYDVALLTVPEWDADDPVEVLWVASSPAVVSVGPGETSLLRVVMASSAHGDLPVQARLLSPRDSWEFAGPFCVGGLLPAQGRLPLDFTLEAPPWATPGTWSAVVRVTAGELVRTTAPIRLEVAG